MKYVELGKTGLKCSIVSFGGIPIQRSDGANTGAVVDALVRYGVNYVDSARAYTVSEGFLGQALRGRREKFIIATKSAARSYQGMKADVETSLKNFQTDHIDLYQLHNLPIKDFEEAFGPDGAYKALLEAQKEGKVGHIGVTLHSADALRAIVEEYADKFETVMFPYNIVENQGHDLLAQAKAKGMGTICMKPLAGGNLEDVDLALRYVHQSGVIDISIPGMGNADEVAVEMAAAERLDVPLTEEEQAQCAAVREKLGNRFCRRCNYCAPCTVGIDIPSAFLFRNYFEHYEGLKDWAAQRYSTVAHKAGECIGCGACEKRCPYELPIREMLKDVAKCFGK